VGLGVARALCGSGAGGGLMGHILQIWQWLRSVASGVAGAIKGLLGRRSSKPDDASAKTIPGPDDRFAFTRRDAMGEEELSEVGQGTARIFKLDPAESIDELMVGDMLTFRIELREGRRPVQSWIWARAICPRRDSIRAVVFKAPGSGKVHQLAVDDVIEVPRDALAHAFRITASGAGVH
jgi:hypothetical protein